MTMDMLESGTRPERDYDLERLIMLSDGVFAIAITLLAIELRPPPGWDGHIASLRDRMSDDLVTYLVSFVTVATYWIMHRRSFRYLVASDAVLTLLNFSVLGLITLLPFATRLTADAPATAEAAGLYVGLIAAIGVATAAQWAWAAFPGRLLRPGLTLRFRLYVALTLLFVPAMTSAFSALSSTTGRGWLMWLIAVFWVGLTWFRRRFVGKMPR